MGLVTNIHSNSKRIYIVQNIKSDQRFSRLTSGMSTNKKDIPKLKRFVRSYQSHKCVEVITTKIESMELDYL